jgi:hypothetical protein
MDTSPRFLQAATVGLPLVVLLGARTGLEMLLAAAVLMAVGIAPEVATRALVALAGILWATRSLGGSLGSELIDASREAFVGALTCGAGLGAAVATAASVLALRALRHARGGAMARSAH